MFVGTFLLKIKRYKDFTTFLYLYHWSIGPPNMLKFRVVMFTLVLVLMKLLDFKSAKKQLQF